MAGVDLIRVEEASLNALQTQRQLFYDGWLLRVSPGKARRARSVNAHFGSTLPVADKIAHCETVYAAHGLPLLFRLTPFVQPPDLESILLARGYVAFDTTLVQLASLASPPEIANLADVELSAPAAADFAEAVGDLRESPPEQRAAHFERLSQTPLTTHAVLARIDGRPVGCGQVALEHGLAGIYDMVTAPTFQNRGLATLIVNELLTWAWGHGATHAYLQVDAGNAPAVAVYRKFGFATAYTYHYCARPEDCG